MVYDCVTGTGQVTFRVRELEHDYLHWGQALITKPHVRRMSPHLHGPASRLFKKILGTAALRKHYSLGNQSLTMELMLRDDSSYHPSWWQH